MQNKSLVLITGASSGIGREIAINLCREDYIPILSARKEKKLIKLQDELSDDGYLSHVIPCDVTKENSIQKLYHKSRKIGFVENIVNNAGFGKFSKISDIDIDDWDKQINTNLRGSFLITKYFINNMIDRRQGRLIFINSVAGKFGYPFSAAYVASKFGLRGFSDSLRNELREYNIKVISIHPGAIDTNFWNNIKIDFSREEMLPPKAVSDIVIHSIKAPDNSVIEEVVIRRTAGDF